MNDEPPDLRPAVNGVYTLHDSDYQTRGNGIGCRVIQIIDVLALQHFDGYLWWVVKARWKAGHRTQRTSEDWYATTLFRVRAGVFSPPQ